MSGGGLAGGERWQDPQLRGLLLPGKSVHPVQRHQRRGSFERSDGANFQPHGKVYCLMYVQTYHWNKGAGSPPGTVGIVRLSGRPSCPNTSQPFLPRRAKGQMAQRTSTGSRLSRSASQSSSTAHMPARIRIRRPGLQTRRRAVQASALCTPTWQCPNGVESKSVRQRNFVAKRHMKEG